MPRENPIDPAYQGNPYPGPTMASAGSLSPAQAAKVLAESEQRGIQVLLDEHALCGSCRQRLVSVEDTTLATFEEVNGKPGPYQGYHSNCLTEMLKRHFAAFSRPSRLGSWK
jgi:hypothetical protein